MNEGMNTTVAITMTVPTSAFDRRVDAGDNMQPANLKKLASLQ